MKEDGGMGRKEAHKPQKCEREKTRQDHVGLVFVLNVAVRRCWLGGIMATISALVTGASRGIGRGIAVELAKAGARVAINFAGNAAAAEAALTLVRAAGGDGFTVQGDVSVAADRARMVAETMT